MCMWLVDENGRFIPRRFKIMKVFMRCLLAVTIIVWTLWAIEETLKRIN